MAHETGTTIIDELKICYIADNTTLSDLKAIPVGNSRYISSYKFYRTTSHHFQYAFDIVNDKTDGGWEKVASGRFGRYGDVEDTGYFFYRVENHVLYDDALLRKVITLPVEMGMTFHNFTSLDLAVDAKIDLARLMKRMWHREDITTIVNGKAIKDRKQTVKNINLVYSTSLDRVKGLTTYVKQSKALHNKTQGITVQAYNKRQEIEEASKKYYISQYYGYPNKLYRLEVHLNNAEINDYCKAQGVCQEQDMIFDLRTLENMFYYHLASVIRFTKGRRKLDWRNIIESNGRV